MCLQSLISKFFGKKNSENDEELSSCTIENTKVLSFENEQRRCKVLSVYDGDTCIVAFKFNDEYYQWRCRLLGLDAPEIRTKDLKEKKNGFKSRDYLKELIENKIVDINFSGYDKYGRVLGTIYLDGKNINDKLLENGYAVVYNK